MTEEKIAPVVAENLDDPFDLDIVLYPVSAADNEAFMTMPDTSIFTHTSCTFGSSFTYTC